MSVLVPSLPVQHGEKLIHQVQVIPTSVWILDQQHVVKVGEVICGKLRDVMEASGHTEYQTRHRATDGVAARKFRTPGTTRQTGFAHRVEALVEVRILALETALPHHVTFTSRRAHKCKEEKKTYQERKNTGTYL